MMSSTDSGFFGKGGPPESSALVQDVGNAPSFLDEPEVALLSTEIARLQAETERTLPETPWYRSIVTVVVAGVLVGLLFLIK
jgi:hypothetical protein